MHSITITDKHGREIVQEDGFYIYYKDGVEVIRTQSLEVMEASAPEPVIVKENPVSRLQSLDKRKIYFYSDKNLIQQAINLALTELDKNLDDEINELECMFETGTIIGCPVPINRLKTNLLFNFHSTPIPQNFNTNLSFKDVSLSVAEDIWKKTDKVCVLWSGGIDSTTALASLIMTKSDWKNHIEVYTTKRAIEEEYPFFYNNLLKDADVKIFQEYEELNNKSLFDNKFFVDGNQGGLLWSPYTYKFFKDTYNEPYKIFFESPAFLEKSIKVKNIREYIEDLISLCPLQIKNVLELNWWLSFINRWDHSAIMHGACIGDVEYINASKSFYDHDLFQCWAMSNMDKKIKDDWKSLKWPAKDLIYELTGDGEYRQNKMAEASGKHVLPHVVITSDDTTKKFSDAREIYETCINLQRV